MTGLGGLYRLLVVVVMVAAAIGCQSSVASAQPGVIGMSVRMMNSSSAEVAKQFDLMAKMGVTLVRVDFDWSAIEGEPEVFDWSYPDLIVDNARQRDMDVLALLSYSPTWARPVGTSSHVPPSNAADFAEFARAAAARYTVTGVRNWEIWNEPNTSDYWEPRPDIGRYSELLRAAAGALHGVDPGATVVTGGLTRGKDTPDGRRISQVSFVDGLYRSGAAHVANAIGVHPYSFPGLPADPDGPVGTFGDLPALHRVTERWGDGGKPIWITEFGAPTGSAYDAISENQQAVSVLQARRLAGTWPWAGPLVIYELRDSGTDPTDLEQNFGVLRADLSPKEAANSLMTDRS